MASARPGGPGIAPGKHPTAERLWHEERKLMCDRCGHELDWNPQEFEDEASLAFHKSNPHWRYVCKSCLDAMPDVPCGPVFGSAGGPGVIVSE